MKTGRPGPKVLAGVKWEQMRFSDLCTSLFDSALASEIVRSSTELLVVRLVLERKCLVVTSQ